MIRIAIDGPGGAGKSSLAKAIAKELGIIYVDTGALYRTIGLFMLNIGINPKDNAGVISHLGDFTLELAFSEGKQIILLNGEDVGETIRTPEVSMAASAVSAIPEVRDYLLNTQRDIAKKNSVIMDGRDIGTVILPDAEVKIFLTASPEARAKRRYEELIAKGRDITYEKVYAEMVERDTNDSTRAVAPCVPAKDAVNLDNSNLTAEGTVKKVLSIIKKREAQIKRWNSYYGLKPLVLPFVKLFHGFEVIGAENVPECGGFVLCSNHIAKRDVVMLALACPRQIKFVAKKELFNIPGLNLILKIFGAVPVDRGGGDVGAIRKSIDLAGSGQAVSIFPQGHRYPGVNPKDTPLRNGAGMIAYRSGAALIPVCIKTEGIKYSLFKKVTVIFGKPISYDELGFNDGGNEEYKAATEKVFAEVIKLGGYDAETDSQSEDK